MLWRIIDFLLAPFYMIYYKIKYSRTSKNISAFKSSTAPKHFFERVVEVIAVEIFLSALGTVLYFTGIFTSYRIVFLDSLVVTVIYLGWNIYCLYTFRLYITGVKSYLLFNLPVYGLLFVSAIVTGCFDTEPYYSFLFLPFKLFYYTTKIWSYPGAGHINRPVSAVMMSIVMLLPVVIMPLIINSHRKKMLTKDNEFTE